MAEIRNAVAASHRDLLERPLVGALTTIDERSRPQTTAVWYLLDVDGLLKVSTTADRQKFKNLERNRECGLFVIDPENPYRTLEIRAQTELVPDPGDVVTARFAEHYGWPVERLVATADRYLAVFHPWRITVNPPVGV